MIRRLKATFGPSSLEGPTPDLVIDGFIKSFRIV